MKTSFTMTLFVLAVLLLVAGCGNSTSSELKTDDIAKQQQMNQQGVSGAARGGAGMGAPGMGGPGMGAPGMGGPGMAAPGQAPMPGR